MDTIALQIQTRSGGGRSYPISKQVVAFGRTDAADVVLDQDRQLSSRHFEVIAEDGQYTLADLGSTNGTQVNGTRVSTCELKLGDKVVAGNTAFLVQPHEIAADSNSSDSSVTTAFDPFNSVHAGMQKPNARVSEEGESAAASTQVVGLEATQTECECGVSRLQGRLPDGASPAVVFEAISHLRSSFLLIDPSRLEQDIPAELDATTCSLLPFLPPEAAGQMPLLISLSQLPKWREYLNEGWGRDAIIVLHSDLDQADLVARLREAMGGSVDAQEPKGILGFCWPSVLESMVLYNPEKFARGFFETVGWALFEVAGDAESWQLFGANTAIQACSSAGVRIKVEEISEHDGNPSPLKQGRGE